MKNIRPAKFVWKHLPIDYKLIWQETLQGAGKAPYGARQPEIHAAQDKEGKITIMQEMRFRKRNVGTHILWVSSAREGEEKNPRQAPGWNRTK